MKRVLLVVLVVAASACSGSDDVTNPETTTTSGVTTTATTAAVTTTEGSTGGDPTPTLSITIAGFAFSGDATGTVGDTVAVTNSDNVGHTWTSTDGAFHSGVLGSGETYTHTFDEPGTYPYFCQIHTEMSGTITIEG